MAGNILSIGKSGLFAAQAALATTGHNIANASVAGYSRQVVVQASSQAQDYGYGFVGSGTQVAEIKRYSDDFLNAQVRQAQASTSAFDAYTAQISQVDNLLADTTSGLSPALQDFFKGVQDLASNPSQVASRQALLSAADSLSARFQGLNGRLQEIRDGVNTQITTSVTLINSYASQIADLNNQIGQLSNEQGHPPNDLLDKRDQLVLDLNKQVKANVVAGTNNSITVTIGSGQPLVVGTMAFKLSTVNSATDPTRVEVGYDTGQKVTVLSESLLTGGQLGGLMDFRANSLDRAQNSLGRVALALAQTFNAQHKLGIDDTGASGGDFFVEAPAYVGDSSFNASSSTAVVTAKVSDVSALTQSDYRVDYDGSNYSVTRLTDNKPFAFTPDANGMATIDGVDITITGASTKGDSFLIKPTINGAAQFAVALADRSKIATGAPIVTDSPLANKGTGKIGEGSVNNAYLVAGNALTTATPVTLTFAAGPPATLSGFPASQAISTTDAAGVVTAYPAGSAVPFAAGTKYSFGGIDVAFTGTPSDGDTFGIKVNQSGVGDNRNARLLGALQTTNILDNKSATFQSSYAELVSYVGNKAREVQVNGQAGAALLTQATESQQSVSGVNLDEEAANLIKYQQAYQAAGKVMQIAGTLFDTLLSIGR
jgi:flagellar hook-associated protein 1 FlgK